MNPVPPALAAAYVAGALGLLPLPAAHGSPEAVSTQVPKMPLCIYGHDDRGRAIALQAQYFYDPARAVAKDSGQWHDGWTNKSTIQYLTVLSQPESVEASAAARAVTCAPYFGAPGSWPASLETEDIFNHTTRQMILPKPIGDPVEEETGGTTHTFRLATASDCPDGYGMDITPVGNVALVQFADLTAAEDNSSRDALAQAAKAAFAGK